MTWQFLDIENGAFLDKLYFMSNTFLGDSLFGTCKIKCSFYPPEKSELPYLTFSFVIHV